VFALVSPPQSIRDIGGGSSEMRRPGDQGTKRDQCSLVPWSLGSLVLKNVNGCRRVTQGSLGLTQPLTAALEKPPALYRVRGSVVFACTWRCCSPRRGGTLLSHASPT